MAEPAAPAVRMRGIHKHFGAVAANADVSLSVVSGTVHGIVGENGAGKSTLMSILTVFTKPTAVRLRCLVRPRIFATPTMRLLSLIHI